MVVSPRPLPDHLFTAEEIDWSWDEVFSGLLELGQMGFHWGKWEKWERTNVNPGLNHGLWKLGGIPQ